MACRPLMKQSRNCAPPFIGPPIAKRARRAGGLAYGRPGRSGHQLVQFGVRRTSDGVKHLYSVRDLRHATPTEEPG